MTRDTWQSHDSHPSPHLQDECQCSFYQTTELPAQIKVGVLRFPWTFLEAPGETADPSVGKIASKQNTATHCSVLTSLRTGALGYWEYSWQRTFSSPTLQGLPQLQLSTSAKVMSLPGLPTSNDWSIKVWPSRLYLRSFWRAIILSPEYHVGRSEAGAGPTSHLIFSLLLFLSLPHVLFSRAPPNKYPHVKLHLAVGFTAYPTYHKFYWLFCNKLSCVCTWIRQIHLFLHCFHWMQIHWMLSTVLGTKILWGTRLKRTSWTHGT